MALTPRQDQMNRALDGQLENGALAEWRAYLLTNPQEAQLYEQLSRIDVILREPPMAAAPKNFTANVMAAIQLGQHKAYVQPHVTGPALALGLALAAVIALPLLGLALLALVQALAGPGALINIVQTVIRVLGAASQAAEQLLLFIGNLLAAYPMAPALLLTVIPLVMLWGWMVWFLRRRERPVTIVVPVRLVVEGAS